MTSTAPLNMKFIRQATESAIRSHDITALRATLADVTSLGSIVYESDEASLTIQLLCESTGSSLFDLGDRLVFCNNSIDLDLDQIELVRVPIYLKLLLEKRLSEQDMQDFVIAYYGEVASELTPGKLIKDIDRSLLTLIHSRMDVFKPLTIALAKFVENLKDKLGREVRDYLDFLIEHGANPNLVVQSSPHEISSPMGIAGASGNIPLAKYFMEKGADSHELLVGGMSLKTLLKTSISPNLRPNEIGWDRQTDTSRLIRDFLFTSGRKQKPGIEELQLLIDAGVDFNLKNENGELPLSSLMLAAKEDKSAQDLTRLLIKHGADVNAFDETYCTPLMVAIKQYKYYTENDKNSKPYQYLKNMIRLLIECGASVTLPNITGLTALHFAIENNPAILPILRKHVDREPANIVEVLLFSGHNACVDMLEKVEKHDESLLEKAFEYAVRLRDREIIKSLATRRFDVVSSLNPLKTVRQAKSLEKTFDLDLLNYLAEFINVNLEPFWHHVLNTGSRIRASRIAEYWLTTTKSEAQARTLLAESDKNKADTYNNIKSRTNEFVKSLHDLFKNLRSQKVLAFDINGSGWAPSDHGWEVAQTMVTEKDLIEFGVDAADDISICYTDTKYLKDEARGFKKGRLLRPMTQALIYYTAPNKVKKLEMANCIVAAASNIGLHVQWDGNTDRAISVSL